MKTEMKTAGWENKVRRVVPYTPGEQPKRKDVIKLNTNECPYPPSPKVKQALEHFGEESLRLYPDPQSLDLVEALADYYHVGKDQVFVGVGSDDVLALSFLTFFNSDKPVLFPDITYSFYDVWADLYRIPYQCQPLDDNFRLKKEDYMVENGGIIFPNPNAPTGLMEDIEVVEEIIAANPDSVVIVDEAYVDFGCTSVIPLVEKYENLLVVQTFSKSRAMAGMRIGYAIGSPKLIGYLNDVKFSFNSYTMNRLTLACGRACVEDEDYFREITQKIIATRERIKPELKRLGFLFQDSRANFIFARHETISAAELFEALKADGIFVRHWNKPRISEYLRITIGTDEEMDRLIAWLENYMESRRA
ncbi:MAG: histidinol-phosphate transaminase [Eubacteriales bacterium]|nr:histidinol-phosphate transaminase [Eubacteriales bacterium]